MEGRRGRIQCLDQEMQSPAPGSTSCELGRPLPSGPISCHLKASFAGPADLNTGLGHKWSNLTGSENSEERVEEGGYEGCCSKRHRLGHPVHGSHKQHVSTRSLLEGEERGT